VKSNAFWRFTKAWLPDISNSEEMVRERYSHIVAGELDDVGTEVLEQIDESTHS